MKKYTLALLLLTSASISYAKEKKVQHDAHEHGVAEMNIVWEKDKINIELLSPAFNITGFEHQPSNHEQEEVIEKIEKGLHSPNELFAFKGASCKAKHIDIDSPFEDDHGHKDHAKHEAKEDHKEHDHDDHKKDDKDAEHDHDEHSDKESTHSEYSISYEFKCEGTKSELTIDTAELFKHLPQMEKIKVQWLTATTQSSSLLTKESNSLTLK